MTILIYCLLMLVTDFLIFCVGIKTGLSVSKEPRHCLGSSKADFDAGYSYAVHNLTAESLRLNEPDAVHTGLEWADYLRKISIGS